MATYLWGMHFFWLCDCDAVKEILEYDGPIHMCRRWAQELLGYTFTCVHRTSKMMLDVDGICRGRYHDPLIASHFDIANSNKTLDKQQNPDKYYPSTFESSLKRRKRNTTPKQDTTTFPTTSTTTVSPKNNFLTCHSVIYAPAPFTYSPTPSSDNKSQTTAIAARRIIPWLTVGSDLPMIAFNLSQSSLFHLDIFCTNVLNPLILQSLLPTAKTCSTSFLHQLLSNPDPLFLLPPTIYGAEFYCPNTTFYSHWITTTLHTLDILHTHHHYMSFATLIILSLIHI